MDPAWTHPPAEIEKEIFSLWQEANPRLAFAAGLREWAGRLYWPSTRARQRRALRIENLLRDVEHPCAAAALRSIHATLIFEEPQLYPENLVWAFYTHVLHDGIRLRHLRNLCRESIEVLRLVKGRLTEEPWPVEIRVLTTSAVESLASLLEGIKEMPAAQGLRGDLDHVIGAARDYGTAFAAPGVHIGSFDEVFPLLEREGGGLDRGELYPSLLSDLHGYPEKAAQIEAYGLEMLRGEVRLLGKAMGDLAGPLDCPERAEDVKKALTARGPKGADLLRFTLELREHLEPIVRQAMVGITPNYQTRIIETPPYLVSLYPTAGMNNFDHFTARPYNIYFLTTSAHAPPGGLAELFQTLVHEEYGHCVNFSNSLTRFGPYRPARSELLVTPLEGPITEGISFQREVEAYDLLCRIAQPEGDLAAPLRGHARGVLECMQRFGGFVDLEAENRFEMHLWRVLRFLRAVGDVRINTGAQSVVDFCRWASHETGLSVKMVYDQVFTFQNWPGYAPCYSLGARPLAEAHRKLRDEPQELVAFNTFVSAMGFPPRRVFEDRIAAWLEGDRPEASAA